MGTRSNIAIKRKDNTIESIYCHWDGYLEHNGIILNNFYQDINKINNLINLGDISLLKENVNYDKLLKHSFDEPQESVVIAYGRDRGEKGCDKKIYQNMTEYEKSLKGSWQEYAYLFDEEKNTWLWGKIPFDTNKDIVFKSLQETLEAKNLIRKTNPDLDKLIKHAITFNVKDDIEAYKNSYESFEDAYCDYKRCFSTIEGLNTHIAVVRNIQDEITEKTEITDDDQIIYDMAEDLIQNINTYKSKIKDIEL